MPRIRSIKLADSKSKTRVRLALVGGETLLGKELEDVLENRPAGATILSFAATGEGNFGEVEGEAVYVEPLAEKTIRDVRALLIAGSPEGARKAYDLAKAADGHPPVIDCTGQLENQPEARIVAPLVSEAQEGGNPVGRSWLLVLAHPAATALALALKRLARHGKLKRVIAHVFEPASERGERGISELHEQTASLLSFKPLKKEVFDTQQSYNLLPEYGEDAAEKLAGIEQRVERHLATLFSSDRTLAEVPMPSLRVIGAPVFHGYSLSLWVEFEKDVNAQELGEALASAQIEVRGPQEEPPDNVGAAGQSGLQAGNIRVDRNNAHAAWFWIVADNLRLTAEAAADLVRTLEAEPA